MLTGNREFNEIYEKYKNLVLKVAYQFSGDLQTAEDIMQDTFLTLYKEQGKEYQNIKSWLCLAAKHRALNYQKRASREVLESVFEDTFGEEANSIQPTIIQPTRESTEEEYLEQYTEERRTEFHEHIMADLLKKNPRWYEAVMLVCLRECPQEEAAKMMCMTKDSFYVLLHRARNWIKKTYGVEYEELKHL